LYLKHNEADGTEPKVTFFMVGKINMEPTWENGALFLNTEDYLCSEDAKYLISLKDGYFWNLPKTSKRASKRAAKRAAKSDPSENWLAFGADDVVILGLFSGFRKVGRIQIRS
jgi:hypothetical protein